jgi:hypothetical protein
MGRVIIYTYSCDSCKSNFKHPDQVLHLKGELLDGDDNVFYEEQPDIYVCRKCFAEKILKYTKSSKTCEVTPNRKEKEVVEQVVEDISYVTLRRINNEDDENEFIQYLGHVSKDNFKKIYRDELIGTYYPIEEQIDFDVCTCDDQEIDIINKAFAGIPQIKRTVCLVDKQNNLAYIDKSLLLKED